MKSEPLTLERANEILRYCPDTGFLYWKVAIAKNIKLGDRAGCLSKDSGYILIGIDGRMYRAHRVAWLITHGKLPEKLIDHMDKVKHNNRLYNLREVDKVGNAKNQKRKSTNTSGITGVRWSKKNKHWQAFIHINKKYTHLGGFAGIFDAACVRKSAELKYGYHPNHGSDL